MQETENCTVCGREFALGHDGDLVEVPAENCTIIPVCHSDPCRFRLREVPT